MKQLSITILLSALMPLSVTLAMDMTDTSLISGQAKLTLHGSDKFGYTIGHELEEEYEERMQNLEQTIGFGLSASYRRGFTPSVLLGLSADYAKSGTMKQKDDFGEVVELVQNPDSANSAKLGSYSLLGISISLLPGLTITEDLMIFGEFGLGGYTVYLGDHAQELNAALNLGLMLDYFVSDALCLELAAKLPLFLADFVFIEEEYSLDPSPVQISFGVAWVRR